MPASPPIPRQRDEANRETCRLRGARWISAAERSVAPKGLRPPVAGMLPGEDSGLEWKQFAPDPIEWLVQDDPGEDRKIRQCAAWLDGDCTGRETLGPEPLGPQ